MSFKIDTDVLLSIEVPDTELNSLSENESTKDLMSNCGCGGRCLSSTT